MTDETLYVEANGLRFAYFEAGSGPLALLLHGFPDTPHSWAPIRPRLVEKGLRVVTPFLRGYAPSGIPPRDADLETLARDVLGLIDALGESSAIVIGHDWGAVASYGAAALAPERVQKLVTIAIPHVAALKPTPRKLWGVRHFLTFKLPGAAARFSADDFAALPAICTRWSPTWKPSPEELAPTRACFADRASLDAALGYYRALSFRPPSFLREKIRVPTIAFAGQDDPVAELEDYRRARRMFTGDYVVEEMPGGHFMHREHPEVFVERLLARL